MQNNYEYKMLIGDGESSGNLGGECLKEISNCDVEVCDTFGERQLLSIDMQKLFLTSIHLERRYHYPSSLSSVAHRAKVIISLPGRHLTVRKQRNISDRW
jgi:hypothetical protein